MTKPIIVWFRQDLRLGDNPALAAAMAQGVPIIPLYILEEGQEWPLGGASRWWLHHSLSALAKDIHHKGGMLILRHGQPLEVLLDVVTTTGAKAVYWNRR